jgi:hypothetical protein
MKLNRRTKISISLALSVLVVLTLLAVQLILGGSQGPSKVDKYEPVASQIVSAKLKADENGRLRLQGAFAGLVPDDLVYVDSLADGRMAVLFPTELGRGQDLAGYLYVSGRLRDSDYTPYPGGKWLFICGHSNLEVTPLASHWYSVSRFME